MNKSKIIIFLLSVCIILYTINCICNKVEFYNSNIFDISLRQLITTAPVMVWFSNLCFDQSGIVNVFQKLQKDLPSGTIVCCSKKPDELFGEFLHTIQVPMSWNKASNVYIYRL
jgi:hypothetical protein